MPRSAKLPDTRQRLLDAGVAAFLRDGYHGAGLKAILDTARVPKGSFYNYFESKEEFASASIEHYSACLAQKLERSLREEDSPLRALRRFFESQAEDYIKADLTGGCLVANLGAELDDSPVCRETLQSSIAAYLHGLTTVIAAAQGAGEVRTDMKPAVLASLLSDAWEGAVIRMKIQQSTDPLRQVLTSFLDGFFRP